MDTNRLLRALRDILDYEASHNIGGLLDELIAQINLNTSEGYQQAEETKLNLYEILAGAPTNSYTPSYDMILEVLGAKAFSGAGAKVRIESIFNNGPLSLQDSITAYREEYRQFMDKSSQLRTGLSTMGFTPQDGDNFEIGFIFPSELDDLQVVSKKLQIWDRFVVICSDIAGEEDTVTRLSSVSNGSVEIFVCKAIAVAQIIEVVMKRVLALYQEIQKVQKTRQEIEGLKLDNAKKKIMLEALIEGEKDQEGEFTEETSKEVFAKHFKNKDKSRKGELESQFNVAIQLILKDVQEGIQVEITPPQVAPEEGDVDSKVAQASQRIATQNVELKKLYNEAPEIRKLPFDIKVKEDSLLKNPKPIAKKAPAKKKIKDS